MRALLVTLFFGLAGAAAFMLSTASADVVVRNPYIERELRSRAAKLRLTTSADAETVWIGHVNTVQAGVPGTPGGAGPHHVGRGPHLLVSGALGTAADFNGTWDFDHYQAGETDSLMGWWPIMCPFGSIGPTNFDDYLRPWFSLDYGNQGNYVIPQGSPKRTFGVVGYWHRDPGNNVPGMADTGTVIPGPGVEWAPIAGAASAWCGLRAEGDNTVMDPVTGNPINSAVLAHWGNNSGNQIGSVRGAGTDHNFPGYGSQWDQLLYRDVNFVANATANVTLNFKYTTRMNLGSSGNHAGQAGWFDKDPLKTAALGDGNYRNINGTDLVDSFMVYVGALVNEAACTFSDGSIGPVYDLQRRWFSEVVKINTPGTTYKQLVSVAGNQGTPAAPIAASIVLTQASVNAILDADGGASNGGRLRVVFRVKTNRGFDDENNGNASGYSSLTRGAAIIDDVSATGGGAAALTNGDFESASSVDNATGTTAVTAWKSTGKPPGAWFHVHRINEAGSPLPFDDPCGAITAPVRFCNMTGGVLSPGNHDTSDKPGGLYGSNTQDQQKYVHSPTINLMSSGVGDYNAQGINSEIASRVPQLWADQLINLYNYDLTGNGFRFGWQSYPATQANGAKCWGEMVKSIFFSSFSTPGCFETLLEAPLDDQLVITSNPSGQPDSFRVYIEAMSRCYAKTATVTSVQCSPSAGALAGGYYDNLSIALVTAAPPPAMAATFSNQFQDCFPVNSQNKVASSFGLAYDTLAVRLQTGYNISPQTGSTSTTGNTARENVSGDSALCGANGDNVRVDLVFRILPGVGNYVTIGNRASGVARRPDQAPRVLATTADPANGALPSASKFWGAYLLDNGAFGTGGNGTTGPGHSGGVWDPNRWNSARMDTTEINFFPVTGLFSNEATANLTLASYMTMYHESDPKFSVLGIAKNRCFYQSTVTKQKIDINIINCGNLNGNPGYPPAGYVNDGPADTSGYNANEIAGQPGKTYEYTKIIPDGQFTPGTEIQYFYRKADIGNAVAFEMSPDTNFVFPQPTETFGYFDFHRWREVRILPDRWKDPAFNQGGTGMACMLVLDLGERRGDLGYWIAVADSIGLTTAAKRGAHNGWRARPDQNWVGVNVGLDDAISRRDNGGQPGSLFDVYSTIAGESNIPSGRPGSRGAAKAGGGSFTINKWSTHGPTEDMVKNYRMLVLLADDIGDEALGPIPDQTDDDIGLFESFLVLPGGSTQPRGFIAQGLRLGELFTVHHPAFMSGFLRATLRNGDYRLLSGNTNNIADISVLPPVTSGGSPFTLGIANQCFLNNDVFTVQVAAPAGQAGVLYENVGSGGPYVAGVWAPASGGSRPYSTLYNGWTMGLFGGMGTQTTLLNVGTRKFFYDLLTNAFGALACQPVGAPVGVGDGNGSGTGSAFVNFMNLKSSNPMRAGEARIAFGTTKNERVQIKIYDVTGRLMKTVADRSFTAGQEHVVIWDGTNDSGQKVKSGVYFYQLKTEHWTSQKKLAVLAN